MCYSYESLSGKMEDRVVIDSDSNGDRTILLQNHEVEPYIHAYYTKYKGVSARKLHNRISRSFCGVSERQIQAFLNRQQISQKLHPKFINKQPPKPVTSPRVLDRIQMDIVDLQKSAVESDSRTYKYVLVVMDIISRFLFLRPLQSKSSTEVATHLIHFVSDVGPPRIVQTDQGTEFKGIVQMFMDKFTSFIVGPIIRSLKER